MSYLTPYGWVLGATDSCISSSHAHHHSHHSRLSSGHKDDGKAGSVEVLGMALKGGREGGKEEEEMQDEEEGMTQAGTCWAVERRREGGREGGRE
jgi:hypothetical protein